MILSLPIDAWLLLLVAVGFGLALEVAFYRARRGDWRTRSGSDAGASSATPKGRDHDVGHEPPPDAR